MTDREREAVERLTKAAVSGFLSQPKDVRTVLAALEAAEAKVAAMEPVVAQHAKCPKVECQCHPDVRWPAERWGHECIISQLMVALRGLLTIPVVGSTYAEAETFRQLNLPLYEKARVALAAADAITFATQSARHTGEESPEQ